MILPFRLLAEPSTAVVALKRALTRMNTYMLNETDLKRKRFVAKRALKQITSMESHVIIKVRPLRERLLTTLTLIRFISTVNSHMRLQVTLLAETL